MDVEGAETGTLLGGMETIKRCKPTLAISIYHSLDDMVSIAPLIHEIEPTYQFYLGHHTMHAEETILYASTQQPQSR